MAGTLYIFFGSSGIGKDYIQSEFINFSSKYTLSDGSKKIVLPVSRLHSRKKRDTEGNTNRYGLSIEEICNSDNYYSMVNGDYVGINKGEIKSSLAAGKNLAYSTGSVEMIEQLINDPDLSNSICLIYINALGYSVDGYIKLESQRKKDQQFSELLKSATERFNNSLLVQEYYNNNQELFNYAYMNITKFANPEIAKKYIPVFFESFFKVVLELKKETGPNWICSGKSNGLKNN